MDGETNRVLADYFFSSQNMTVEMCLTTCLTKGLNYAGLKRKIECYCVNKPEKGFNLAWFDKCTQKCEGNQFQMCGGSDTMSITGFQISRIFLIVYF